MMRTPHRLLLWNGAGAAALAVIAYVVAPAPAAAASPAATPPTAEQAAAAAAHHVSPDPAKGTPALVATGQKVQVVRQIVQCGGTMYAVGRFAKISQGGTTYSRSGAFSFGAKAPYKVTSWNPQVQGEVHSIALTKDCRHAYIGGHFTKAGGKKAKDIAEVRTYNNTLVTQWGHNSNGGVNTLLLTGKHLLAGGFFTSVNGSSDRYYASLSPATGRDDGYLHFGISGHYDYPGVVPNPTQVFNQQISPDRHYVLAEGDFTSVQGKARQQIFMFRLAASHGNVTTWNSTEFSQPCVTKHPFYITTAAWAPDQSAIYLADTGLHLLNWNGKFPLTGLCDATAAFPAKRSVVSHKWVNYTGCDSLYAIAASATAVYVAGHPRWSQNANGCNNAGRGSVNDRGLQGLWPGNGRTILNVKKTKGRYTMARANADDMLLTGAGLWIASTNRFGLVSCGNVGGHAGICFLPYPR
jgi:hypothetical protein